MHPPHFRKTETEMNTTNVIYLGCPYSYNHPDKAICEAVMLARYNAVTRIAAELFSKGRQVYSPITHSHPLTHNGAPTDWPTWKEFDLHMLRVACRELYVCCFDGWEQSTRLTAEREETNRLGYQVTYLLDEKVDYKCPKCGAVHSTAGKMAGCSHANLP
jgi:hypothetical protein